MRLPSLLVATALASAAGLAADTVDFHEHLGLQLYSLRGQITMNPPGTLDLARSYGITEVETAGTANLPVERFSALLKERGLQAIGAHMGYDLLKKNFAGALRDAKALGITYLTVPSVPSEKGKGLTAKAAHEAAANLDAWGKALRAEGIILCYHPHGIEFRPLPEEGGATGYDILVRETRPENLHFEIDVFWAYHAGQDPAAMIRALGKRCVLVHLKDLRRGAPRATAEPSRAPATDIVAVGSGEIDWKQVLTAARDAGVAHYFIEDETPDPLRGIPDSLRYLRQLTL